MTRTVGVVGLLVSLSVAGCMKRNIYSVTADMEEGIIHSVGGYTERDVAAEVFHRHSRATGRQIVLINYSHWDYKPEKAWYGIIDRHGIEPGRKKYELNLRASQTEASRILAYVLSSGLFSSPGVTNTMAVLVCGASDNAQVYRLKDSPLPTYVVSPGDVDSGEVLHDAFSANLLKLAQAASGANKGHVVNVFPFEPLNLDQFRLRPDYYGPINEFRTFRKRSLSEGIAEQRKRPEESADYTRDKFMRKVTVPWPKLLGDAHMDADVLVVWWNNIVGSEKPWRINSAGKPWPPYDTRDQIPYNRMILVGRDGGVPLDVRCARVCARDGIVYYYKTALPQNRWSLEQHLEVLAKGYQEAAATSQPLLPESAKGAVPSSAGAAGQ